MIKRSKCENKGIVPSEMELVLEYTQQGASHEVSKPGQYICCQNHKLIADIEDDIMDPRLNMQSTVSLTPRTFKDGDGNTLYQQSVKASANSVIIFFFTSAQDGNKLLDDERLSLADDLKKAHDQNQNKSK
ncbi:hypothetical protein Tco_1083577 [Tanacetum coccineum]